MSSGVTLTVRLDAETAELVMRLRRRRSSTKSDVIREAIRELAARDLRVRETIRPYEAVRRLVGSVNSRGLHLSKRTGEQFSSLLAERRRARRSRWIRAISPSIARRASVVSC